jgi:nitrate reductase NapD
MENHPVRKVIPIAKATTVEQEIHIAGVVVYTRPEHLDSIRSCIDALPGADVHANDASGKLVVTLETESTKRTLDIMDAMRALPGVIDVVLVYQHAEPVSALDLEVQ